MDQPEESKATRQHYLREIGMPHSPPSSCKVYTPQRLADAMVAAIADDQHITWLEPGCGNGVFLRSLHAMGVSTSVVHAIELDRSTSESDSLARVARGVDYLHWARCQELKFDCIVGNPPYIAIRSLPSALQSSAAHVLDHQGLPIGKRSNTWYAFLQSSLRLLKEGGNLAFVLPASCEFADYCKTGREHIIQMFERVDLVRSQRPLFSEVQEGAAVLVCRNKRDGQAVFRRHEVQDLQSVIERLQRLTNHKARACPSGRIRDSGELIRLGDVLTVKLGGVTGDMRFFALTERQRRNLGLPLSCVTPVVTKCRQVRRPQLDSRTWENLKLQNERIWLFKPSERFAKWPTVRRYLELSEDSGGCRKKAFKVRNRVPWYRTPLPDQVHGFVSGMSGDGIWICVNMMERLNATNTLYVVSYGNHLSINGRYACALALLTTTAANQLRRLRRRYADGLTKIEPGELADVQIPKFGHVRNARPVYCQALSSLLDGDGLSSRQIADAAISNGGFRP